MLLLVCVKVVIIITIHSNTFKRNTCCICACVCVGTVLTKDFYKNGMLMELAQQINTPKVGYLCLKYTPDAVGLRFEYDNRKHEVEVSTPTAATVVPPESDTGSSAPKRRRRRRNRNAKRGRRMRPRRPQRFGSGSDIMDAKISAQQLFSIKAKHLAHIPRHPIGQSSLLFYVSSVTEFVERIRRLQYVVYIEPRMVSFNRTKVAVVLDPNGVKVTLIQYNKVSRAKELRKHVEKVETKRIMKKIIERQFTQIKLPGLSLTSDNDDVNNNNNTNNATHNHPNQSRKRNADTAKEDAKRNDKIERMSQARLGYVIVPVSHYLHVQQSCSFYATTFRGVPRYQFKKNIAKVAKKRSAEHAKWKKRQHILKKMHATKSSRAPQSVLKELQRKNQNNHNRSSSSDDDSDTDSPTQIGDPSKAFAFDQSAYSVGFRLVDHERFVEGTMNIISCKHSYVCVWFVWFDSVIECTYCCCSNVLIIINDIIYMHRSSHILVDGKRRSQLSSHTMSVSQTHS